MVIPVKIYALLTCSLSQVFSYQHERPLEELCSGMRQRLVWSAFAVARLLVKCTGRVSSRVWQQC
jgi:hypothetical protein